jgi:PAS domain S-box-containing protein
MMAGQRSGRDHAINGMLSIWLVGPGMGTISPILEALHRARRILAERTTRDSSSGREDVGAAIAEIDRGIAALGAGSEPELLALRREVERLGAATADKEGLLDAVLRQSPHGILICDAPGKLILQNEAAERIWAGSANAESVADWTKYRAFHADGRPYGPGDWQMARCLTLKVRNEAEEFHIQRFDDSHAYLLGSSAPIFGAGDKLMGAVSVFADITHLKRVEAALGMSEQRFSTTLRSIGDAVIATDADGRITFMNPVAESLTGVAFKEGAGRPLDDVFRIVNEKTRAPTESPVAKVIRQGAIVGMANHTVLIRPDGTELAIDDSAAPIRNTAGNLAGVVLVFRDVTLKRRDDDRRGILAEASAQLASSLDYQATLTTVARLAVPDFADWAAVDLVEVDGRISRLGVAHVDPQKVEWVAEIERRYPPDPNAPLGVPNIVRTGRSEMMSEIPDDLLTASAKDPEHLDIIRKLGLRSYIGVPLTARGRILGAITFATAESRRLYGAEDLAFAEDLGIRAAFALDNARLYQAAQDAHATADEARRAAERDRAALEEERNRLATILDQMPAGVMIAEAPSGKVIYANKQAAEIFRGSVTTVEQAEEYDRVFKAWHADGRVYRADEFPLVRAVAGKIVKSQEVIFQRADGTKGVVRANAAPIADKAGKVVAAVTAYYDATEMKRAAEERERLYAAAQRAVRSRDDLLAVVSHDLRNPLGVVAVGAARLQRIDAVDEQMAKVVKQAETIKRAADRMERLINDLLDIAAIEAGQISVRPQVVEVDHLLRDVVEMTEPLAEPKSVRLKVQNRAPGRSIACDRDRVLQVFSNVLGNAIKFCPSQSEIELTVATVETAVQFSIADCGPGIPSDQVSHIFERYWRGSRDKDGGVGLGLAIAKGIVDAHQGGISVESKVGAGTTVSFRLPIASADVQRS